MSDAQNNNHPAEVHLDVVQMKRLYAAVLENRADDAVAFLASEGVVLENVEVLTMAHNIRNASAKTCFFDRQPTRHKTGWRTDTGEPSMSWEEVSAVSCPCLNEFRRSRKNVFPNWERDLDKLTREYHAGHRPGKVILYTDKCAEPGCTQHFSVTLAQAAVEHLRRRGAKQGAAATWTGWSRCSDCVRKRSALSRPALQKDAGSVLITARRSPKASEALKTKSVKNALEVAQALAEQKRLRDEKYAREVAAAHAQRNLQKGVAS